MTEPGDLPELSTGRLRLRRTAPSDAIVALADNWEVVRWLARLPFPFRRREVLVFLEEIVTREVAWIIERREDRCLMGVIGLAPAEKAATAELDGWLGQPF